MDQRRSGSCVGRPCMLGKTQEWLAKLSNTRRSRHLGTSVGTLLLMRALLRKLMLLPLMCIALAGTHLLALSQGALGVPVTDLLHRFS